MGGLTELVNERAQMDNLNQNIQTELALEIAQLSLDKATLQAQVEQLRQQNEELQSQKGDDK